MSDSVASTPVVSPPLQLVRLPVDKPNLAVEFLRQRSGGVMDLIAHFWERLSHTPPLLRQDLHLVVCLPIIYINKNININTLDSAVLSGAMLYVPKAHRADVLATEPQVAGAFASYIAHQGAKLVKSGLPEGQAPDSTAVGTDNRGQAERLRSASGSALSMADELPAGSPMRECRESALPLSLLDLSAPIRTGAVPETVALPSEPAGRGAQSPKVPIDFLTGPADGINWMTPLLLPLVNRKAPARKLVNVVMQLPTNIPAGLDPHVRLARDSDIPTLNRWRRQYKEERGIQFDADMDAWVERQRVFVYEIPAEGGSGRDSATGGVEGVAPPSGDASHAGTIVSIAKIDLDLSTLIEIGGVYTFPEYRTRGYGDALVKDMVTRIRQAGKTPTLQVDELNTPAVSLYEKAGWQSMGKLARVWLTGT